MAASDEMSPRERVIAVISGQRPDRIPLYGWVRANLAEPIAERWGSVEAFEDQYEFDFAHLFGGPLPYDPERVSALRRTLGRPIEPRDALELEMSDPADAAAYADIVEQIRHHKEQRGRFVYVQTPGIFECLNSVFGIENHLAWLALYPEDLAKAYRRQAEWNRSFALQCLALGADMIHVSDDWGAQSGLMFSPRTWRELIYPHHKITCDAVRDAGGFLSLHSDGNIRAVVEGVMELGYQVVHPWQESAGMSLQEFHDRYRGRFAVMGGLDVQTTIGFGDLDRLAAEIERVMRLFADGGLLFCTSHFVQEHCTMDELAFAFDTAYEWSRRACRERS